MSSETKLLIPRLHTHTEFISTLMAVPGLGNLVYAPLLSIVGDYLVCPVTRREQVDIVHRLISKGLGSSRSHGHLLFHRPGTGRAGGPVVVIEDASISCKETMVTAARYGGGRGDRYNVFQGSESFCCELIGQVWRRINPRSEFCQFHPHFSCDPAEPVLAKPRPLLTNYFDSSLVTLLGIPRHLVRPIGLGLVECDYDFRTSISF